jgi:hypothetical protein
MIKAEKAVFTYQEGREYLATEKQVRSHCHPRFVRLVRDSKVGDKGPIVMLGPEGFHQRVRHAASLLTKEGRKVVPAFWRLGDGPLQAAFSAVMDVASSISPIRKRLGFNRVRMLQCTLDFCHMFHGVAGQPGGVHGPHVQV